MIRRKPARAALLVSAQAAAHLRAAVDHLISLVDEDICHHGA